MRLIKNETSKTVYISFSLDDSNDYAVSSVKLESNETFALFKGVTPDVIVIKEILKSEVYGPPNQPYHGEERRNG